MFHLFGNKNNAREVSHTVAELLDEEILKEMVQLRSLERPVKNLLYSIRKIYYVVDCELGSLKVRMATAYNSSSSYFDTALQPLYDHYPRHIDELRDIMKDILNHIIECANSAQDIISNIFSNINCILTRVLVYCHMNETIKNEIKNNQSTIKVYIVEIKTQINIVLETVGQLLNCIEHSTRVKAFLEEFML